MLVSVQMIQFTLRYLVTLNLKELEKIKNKLAFMKKEYSSFFF